MIIASTLEDHRTEKRIAITPDTAKKYITKPPTIKSFQPISLSAKAIYFALVLTSNQNTTEQLIATPTITSNAAIAFFT